LAARSKENPSDQEGWLKLAQAYKVMGRYAEAAEAYAKSETKVKADASLLASYAETLGMASDKGLRGKPTALIDAALKLNPKEPNALLLAGAAAMERQDFKVAIAYWEQLLPMVEPGSEIEGALKDGIERLRSKEAAKRSGKNK
jgi:cytochrome c-type biogenesis protein CcmH